MDLIINGLDKSRWLEIQRDGTDHPDHAKHSLKAHTEWIGRARSHTSISTSYGKTFEIDGDEPPSLMGEGMAPKAVEYLLHALGSCLAVGMAYNAMARGISLKKVSIDLEGDIDLRGFLGISSEVRPGYQKMRVLCRVESDASLEELEDLWAYVQRTSPVLDAISRGTSVSLVLE